MCLKGLLGEAAGSEWLRILETVCDWLDCGCDRTEGRVVVRTGFGQNRNSITHLFTRGENIHSVHC